MHPQGKSGKTWLINANKKVERHKTNCVIHCKLGNELHIIIFCYDNVKSELMNSIIK